MYALSDYYHGIEKPTDNDGYAEKASQRHEAKINGIRRRGTKYGSITSEITSLFGVDNISSGVTSEQRDEMILDLQYGDLAMDPSKWEITSRASIDANGNPLPKPELDLGPELDSEPLPSVEKISASTNNRSEAVKEKVRQVREARAARQRAQESIEDIKNKMSAAVETVSNKAEMAKYAAKNVDKGIMSEAWNFIKGHKRILGIGGGLAVAGAVAYGIAYNRGKGSTY